MIYKSNQDQDNIPSMKKVSKRPSAFLDRDGVLNKDIGFAHKPSQIEWISGAKAAVAFLKNQGYLVFVVTNQSGIARGLYTEDDVERLHAWMNKDLLQAGSFPIDDFRYSPYHPEFDNGNYSDFKDWRKPSPGMILDIMEHWPVDNTRSFLIGDRKSDIKAAEAANIRGFLFDGGDLLSFVEAILASQ
ncbi:MAG: HAD family hydrolase [Pseudomonadota bacterium]|nr:HAD family hydrolase [Pseudomonadota bacterium]